MSVTFHSANPRNNQRLQESYLTVERSDDGASGSFRTIYTDGDWCTSFTWVAGKADKYAFGFSAESVATVDWTIPSSADGAAKAGTYRICHKGDYKELLGKIVPFSGCSQVFEVTA